MKPEKKQAKKLGLHKHIATGGKPSTYQGAAENAVWKGNKEDAKR